MSDAIARALGALDQHPVSYRTTATDTIVEAESAEQVFAAVQAAHRAIPDDRVITSVEIDEDRRRSLNADERVASVERALGHPAQRQREPVGRPARQPVQQPDQRPVQQPVRQSPQPPGQQPTQQPPRRPARQRSRPTQADPDTHQQPSSIR